MNLAGDYDAMNTNKRRSGGDQGEIKRKDDREMSARCWDQNMASYNGD